MPQFPPLAVVIPAAGIGKRMQADKAKQYLTIHNKTILEHTVECFIELDFVTHIYVSIAQHDQFFSTLPVSKSRKVIRVGGGKERADSVLNGVIEAQKGNHQWVMVHDAARPCVSKEDIKNLYQSCLEQNEAGILATPVRDTMKRSHVDSQLIASTEDRNGMWHALTPQCAKVEHLHRALSQKLEQGGFVSKHITDEASALEFAGIPVNLVQGSVKNIKVTLPEDLELAKFYLSGKK